MKLMIVEDDKRCLDRMIFLLSSKKEFQHITITNDRKQTMDYYNQERPDVVLIDIEMPGMNGLETVKEMLWSHSSVKFIAIAMCHDKAYLAELICAGFNGCVFKSEVSSKLVIAILEVMEGRYFFPADIQLKANSHPDPYLE